jgi:UDP-glucose 4-epimerase
VTDLARGHIAALTAAQEGRIQGGYRTFNLGTGTGYSVLEVVAAMESISGRSIPRTVVGRRAGDVQSSVAAADRARNELGWQTTETLSNACRDTWNRLRLTGGQISEIPDTDEEEFQAAGQAIAMDLEKQ